MKRAAPWFAALLLLVSCQARGPAERSLPLVDARIAAWLDDLSRSADSRHALRAQARLGIDAPDLRFRRPQRLVVARPERLRVEVIGLFGQVAAVLVTNGGQYQFFDPGQGQIEQGEASEDVLWRLARVDLTPEEATDVLLGAPRPEAGLVAIAASAFSDGGIAVVLAAPGAGFGRQRFEFDALGRVRSVQRFGADGLAIWSARFEDYRPAGEHSFAFRVALSFPRVEADAEIEFKQVELNPPDLPDDVFVLSVAGGVE